MLSSHPLFKKIACALMSAALFLMAGGHLAVLQGVAWTTMLRDFSRASTLSTALDKTFDGQHLCPLCKKIARVRAAEGKAPTSVKVEKKAELFLALTATSLPLPICRPAVFLPAPFVAMLERSDAPPVPVPRLLA